MGFDARSGSVELFAAIPRSSIPLCGKRRDFFNVGEYRLADGMQGFGRDIACAAERRYVSPGDTTADAVRRVQAFEITALVELDLTEITESGDPLLPQHSWPADVVHCVIDCVLHRVGDHSAERSRKGARVLGNRLSYLPEYIPGQDTDARTELFAEAARQCGEQLTRAAEFVAAGAFDRIDVPEIPQA